METGFLAHSFPRNTSRLQTEFHVFLDTWHMWNMTEEEKLTVPAVPFSKTSSKMPTLLLRRVNIFALFKKDICPWLPDWKIRKPLPPKEVEEWKTSQHSASSSPISSFFNLPDFIVSLCSQSHSFKATFWKSHISKNLPRPQVDTGAKIATNWRKKFGMSTNKSSAKERTKTLRVIIF